MTLRKDRHPYARQDATVTATGETYQVEDYWDRLTGESWTVAAGNPACLTYAIRSAGGSVPLDDEVLYGKIDGIGHLFHVSELTFPATTTR